MDASSRARGVRRSPLGHPSFSGERSSTIDPEQILDALGGDADVMGLEPCIVRLRAVLADPERVDEAALRDAGASTVMRIGRVVHVVVGPEGGRIAGRIRASLGGRV